MTKIPHLEGRSTKYIFQVCGSCNLFVRFENKDIGVCEELQATHRGHVLDIGHCACEFWEKEKS